MKEGKLSATVVMGATMRAVHLLRNGPPKIFGDTLALRLSGYDSRN